MKFDILNRFTGEVQFTSEIDYDGNDYGVKVGLAVIWGIKNKADLRSANLQDADLRSANLQDANLRSADLRYAVGNMSEVKSLQLDTWSVTYTHDIMYIGCQSHSIDLWRKSDPRWIAKMDKNATEWWNKFGKIILALIDASPATKPEFQRCLK